MKYMWKNVSVHDKPLRRADSDLVFWLGHTGHVYSGVRCFLTGGHLPVYDGTEYFQDSSYRKHYHCASCDKKGII